MLKVDRKLNFIKKIGKIKDNSHKQQIKKLIRKIILNPLLGKPMRYARKGTREVYLGPFRLSYVYIKHEDKIVLFDLYHKDEQ